MEARRLGESTEHVKCRSGARASGLTGNVRRDCLAFLRSQDNWVLGGCYAVNPCGPGSTVSLSLNLSPFTHEQTEAQRT